MRAATASGPWVSLDVELLLQTLGWASVVWLLTVDVMIRRGRIAAGGVGFRLAGMAAASCVVLASAAERLWPVAVLGLLWLRTEVFGYRSVRPHGTPADADELEPEPELVAPLLVPGFGVATDDRPSPGPWRERIPHPHLPHAHLPHPHLPHPHLPRMSRRFVTIMFRIEMAVVVSIAAVFLVIWAQQQRALVGNDANATLCNWIDTC